MNPQTDIADTKHGIFPQNQYFGNNLIHAKSLALLLAHQLTSRYAQYRVLMMSLGQRELLSDISSANGSG
jgi:hypothetical protein